MWIMRGLLFDIDAYNDGEDNIGGCDFSDIVLVQSKEQLNVLCH